jgi:heme-degrading monooxygenase HmoA
MFAVIRTYHGKPGTIAGVAHRFEKELLPQLSAQPGFVSYNVIEGPNDVGVVVSLFQDRAAADAANKVAVDWAKQNVAAQVGMPEVLIGEVIVSSAQKI